MKTFIILIVCFGLVLSDETCQHEKDEFKKLLDNLEDDRGDTKNRLQELLQGGHFEIGYESAFKHWWSTYAFNQIGGDKPNKEVNEKFCEVFEQGYEIMKCYYHNLLKNVSKSAEKSNKMNDEQRKQFIDGVNQIDKTMNQTNCNQDKDTLLSYKRSIEKKVNELLEINGVRGDPELRQIQNLKFEMSIPSYYENLYTLGMVKHGKKPDDKVTCQFIGSC